MNTKYKYKKIDAFTSGTSLGNPAACLYLSSGESLCDNIMLDIAKRHKGFVSEVVYCSSSDDGIKLTYYSSEREVDFCGHGTIACMYSLIKNDPYLLAQQEIYIDTNRKGKLTVYNQISEKDAVLIASPDPVYIGTQLSIDQIAENLGLFSKDLNTELPIDLIDAGLRTLVVPIGDLETVKSFYPDEHELKEFCVKYDIDIILVYSMETAEKNNIAHTRVFAPKFGYLEDPATGSGNSSFGYYMLKNGLWDKSDCVIEQGGNDRIFNKVSLSYKNSAVLFGGSATVRIDGVYIV